MDSAPETLNAKPDDAERSPRELVRPLPWASRLSAMPYLPGGGANQIAILRELLRTVLAHEGLLTASVVDGSGQERSLRDAVKPLSSAGFVQTADRHHTAVTAEASAWLESDDNAALVGIFHRHVRYVGELLEALRAGPLTVRELMQIAAEQYDLPWNTPDQTRRRVTWLSCLGAVEYRTATHVAITEHGKFLLEGLLLGSPARTQAERAEPVEFRKPPPAIGDLVESLTPAVLAGRNPSLGYVPRGKGETDVVQALGALVNAASPSITKADLLAFAEAHFGVSASSFGAVLTTLTRSKLIEQTALNVYEPTSTARAWLETTNPLDLALLLHARYLFVLEIIPLLGEHDRAPDLARAAVEYYGMPRADVGGVRTRLQILKAGGLIVERANWRYQPSALGEEVAARYPLQAPTDGDAGEADVATVAGPQDTSSATQIARRIGGELVSSGTDSDNPIRLEKAVEQAFQFLGFDARHIGGGGKTDVMATVDNKDLKPVRLIVDAKSARSGSVNEGAVSFDTLREHRAQHRADHVVLVGPSFDTGRVRARAAENAVTLITTAGLADVLARHARTPLSAYHYLRLVTGKDDDRRELDMRWSAAQRRTNLMAQIITVLAEEARDADEVTGGALTSDQIYLIARTGETGPRPQPGEIESILELLQHPLIDSVRAVQPERGKPVAYYLVDDPSLVQDKLTILARALEGLGRAIGTTE